MNKKVIVVDDMLMVAEMVAGILYSIGIDNVIIFDDPYKALEEIKNNNNIKIVISDYRMPVIDGIEFIKEAKKINEQVNCILITSENYYSIEKQADCCVLNKQIDFNSNLIKVVQEYY